MSDIHGETISKNQSNAALLGFQMHRSSNQSTTSNTQSNLRYIDLDMGVNNASNEASSSTLTQRITGNQSSNSNRQQHKANAVNATISTKSSNMSYLNNVPANMKIAGRVTGTGNFKHDASDESLQEYIESQQSAVSFKNRGQSSNIQLAAQFPTLQATTSSQVILKYHRNDFVYITSFLTYVDGSRQEESIVHVTIASIVGNTIITTGRSEAQN